MKKIIKEIKLARGLLIRDGKILLAQDIRPNQGHFFLPGGNVDSGEPIKSALPREWHEELGWEIRAGSFLGCLEHKWSYTREQDGALVEVFEVNYLFTAEASAQTIQQDPISKESHLKFSWVPISELSSINLLPSPLKSLIHDISNSKTAGVWASTL